MSHLADYRQFIASKRIAAVPSGFDVPRSSINPLMHQWQGDCCIWSIRRGRSAAFWDCGLGKEFLHLEWARHVHMHTGKPVLIVAPLIVSHQTIREAAKFSIEAPVRLCIDQLDANAHGGICITNYEKLHKFDLSRFVGVALNEASILKSFMGKTKQALCEGFRSTPYKMVLTATPSPNDLLELGNYADFLGIMPAREMIARWFINDTMHAGRYRLRKHGEEDFWRWVASWAICLSSPADLGFPDTRYVLPSLNVEEIIVKESEWFGVDARNVSATGIHEEKRESLTEKCEAIREVVSRRPDEKWVIWCDTNYEQDVIEKIFPRERFVSIRGSDTEHAKIKREEEWRTGSVPYLITKADIFGHGLNWQHCHNMTWFAGWSFEKWYQAVRRFLRFGQIWPVNVFVIASEKELGQIDATNRKSQMHELVRSKVATAMKGFQQAEIYGRDLKLQTYQPTKRMELPKWILNKTAG
jgi:hypothetical protein